MIISNDSSAYVALGLTGMITIAIFASRRLFAHDSREPPLAPQSVPIIGHIIGLSRSTFNYYVDLSERVGLPIFTMPLPGQKMYVITKPELIQTVQKQYKILAFPPIQAKFTSLICSVSDTANVIVKHNANGEDGDHGLLPESSKAINNAMRPGDALDDMNRIMLREVGTALDLLSKGVSGRFELNTWLRDTVTIATTRSVYGPLNPFEDKKIADDFWEFEKGLMAFLIGFLPSITARKPKAASERVASAIEAYYKAGGVDNASVLVKNRYNSGMEHKVPLLDIARFEVGGSLAVLVNTGPAAFWTLLLFHSHPGLRDEIRAEVDKCTVTTSQHGTTTKSIDLAHLKEKCPLLLSAYQEVLRYSSIGTSVREVTEDTYLDTWLLKKGAMLQMPSRVVHHDKEIWGSNASDFVPRRFLAEERHNRPRDLCFRAFGGGKHLCPGRHFATNEVLATVAAFIARLDMTPIGGEWKHPTTKNTNAASVIMEPDYDVEVEIRTRPGFEDVTWALKLNKSDKIFAIVTEDVSKEESDI